MDVPQLKLLAGRVRGLLEQNEQSVSHGQALDLIAALPGLRNWPEVMAFPDRVAACRLDLVSTGRLSYRLKRVHGLDVNAAHLLMQLQPPQSVRPSFVPEIWPSGPAPGVYVTDSQDAINALLSSYEEASDGAPVYAERAGDHVDAAIYLGDNGLWSGGLDRIPSGTLLVVGPLELNQQSWEESAKRMEMACLQALVGNHRVAVLVDTPTPESIFDDLELMVRAVQPEGADNDTALTGAVTEKGALELRKPFARGFEPPIQAAVRATGEAVPAPALHALEEALAGRATGLLLVGSPAIEEHFAIDLVVAMLSLTEHLGPAARIKPRNRGTPEKDMMVPEPVRALPFLPSVQSAYARGYRRLVVDSGYTLGEVLADYSDKALLIEGAFGMDAGDVFTSAVRSSWKEMPTLLHQVIAVLGVGRIESRAGLAAVTDLYVATETVPPANARFGDIDDHITRHRVIRWQDELERLLDAKQVSVAAAKKGLERIPGLKELLAARANKKERQTPSRYLASGGSSADL